jgi:hypothetical protein
MRRWEGMFDWLISELLGRFIGRQKYSWFLIITRLSFPWPCRLCFSDVDAITELPQ